jgi:hypothetical protein
LGAPDEARFLQPSKDIPVHVLTHPLHDTLRDSAAHALDLFDLFDTGGGQGVQIPKDID